MRITLIIGLAFGLFVVGMLDFAEATPLTLDYSVTSVSGGLYDYEFKLVLDNHDNTWVPGKGWRWLVFGDHQNGPSPLTDFVGDSTDLPIGPWTSYVDTNGFHNGPTLGYVVDFWVPISIGETLSWSGTSTANLSQGELLFSTIGGTLNDAVAADFEVANRHDNISVPEPAAILLFGSGVAAIAALRRKLKS